MISLSREWAMLSRAIYGQEFIDELAEFLRKNGVKTILECGCGDGYILHGLAERDFSGLGIDSDPEMIEMALQENTHPSIGFKQMDWLDLYALKKSYDSVICRGNSLSNASTWKKEKSEFDTRTARDSIIKSIAEFFKKIKNGGLLYLDTISMPEIDEVNVGNIHLMGEIEYDWERKMRCIHGGGRLGDEDFYGGSVSYLLLPEELQEMIKLHKPSRIWSPKFEHEKIYHVICAKK